MFDFDGEIYKDQQLVKVNFGEYIKNKKVLICPNVKMLQKPTLKYFKYVEHVGYVGYAECVGHIVYVEYVGYVYNR